MHPSSSASAPASSLSVAALITASGCSLELEAVDLCMGERDRAWSACQREVRDLRTCHAAAQQQRERARTSPGAASETPAASVQQ